MTLHLACRTLVISALVFVLGACQWRDGHVVLGDTDIHPPAPAQIAWTEVSHRVAFTPGRAELNAVEAGAIDTFLARADVTYGDRVTVLTERGAPMADQRVEAVRRYLRHRNIPVAVARQPERALGQDEVALSVGRYRAVAGACANWDRALSGGGINGGPESFGCTTTAARAHHAVDPGDLLGGNTMGDADGAFAALGVRRYHEGVAGEDASGQAETFKTGGQ